MTSCRCGVQSFGFKHDDAPLARGHDGGTIGVVVSPRVFLAASASRERPASVSLARMRHPVFSRRVR